MRLHNASATKVLIGGIIPERDRSRLLELGVSEVFTPKDSDLGVIVERIAAICGEPGRE
jgi:(2R)-ethylmalonyl-CoA mutase